MGFILHIETATKNCSVALSSNNQLIALKELATLSYSHAEKLHLFIEELLFEEKLSFQDIQAVAISEGPGSYTGLRIGVAAAKGFCFALNIPLIAIDTLEILAKAIQIENGVIIPMIDARRKEVFTTVFDAKYNKIVPTQAKVLEENSFTEFDLITILGDGSLKASEIMLHPNAIFKTKICYPSAKEMVSIAFKKYIDKDFVDLAYFEPNYGKEYMS